MKAMQHENFSSFLHLVKIFIPITLSLLSSSFLLLVDRAFISRYSLVGLEACTTAASICLFLQLPIMRISSMTNPIVGNLIGGGKEHEVGRYVWQMIWFSFFSSILMISVGLFAIHFVLNGSFLRGLSLEYLQIILPFIFLFPIGTALSSFFIAAGKRYLVLKITLISHLINALMNYLLIFGVSGLIPSMGVRGAAIGTVVAQGYFCIALFSIFIGKGFLDRFKTRDYQLNAAKLIELVKKWSLFGIAKFITLAYWLIVTRLMLINGEKAILILSLGSTLFGSFVFITDGFNQAMITSASYLFGAKDWKGIWRLVKSSFILLALISGVLAIPCIIFRERLLLIFIKESLPDDNFLLLMNAVIYIWLFFITDGFNRIFQSLLFASGDAIFHLVAIISISFFTSVVTIYSMLTFWHVSPDKVWIAYALESFIIGSFFYIRSAKKIQGQFFFRSVT